MTPEWNGWINPDVAAKGLSYLISISNSLKFQPLK